MPITKQINSRANGKQLSPADMPQNPAQIVTNYYSAVSTAAQTIINLSFAVDQANTSNFLLVIDGKVLTVGASNDYAFTNIQPNNTSSQVTLAAAIGVSLNIQAWYLGVFQASFSLASALASINTNTANIPKNYLINSNFDFWQRGNAPTSTTTVANTLSTYFADRWYVKNSLGTNGVITYSQIAGTTVGSLFAAKIQITTAPTAAQANGCELYQVLPNDQSIELYQQVISGSAQIKALGNVTQVGIQFAYATGEVKPTLFLGSEQLVNVNTSTFSPGQIANQSVGSLPTTSGVVGIRIRIRTVSTGNTYDLNNGFIVEQAMLNLGPTVANYSRGGRTMSDELQACQRFYEKSYDTPVAPGSINLNGAEAYNTGAIAGAVFSGVRFKVTKWASPTITAYSPATGTSGQIRNVTDGTDVAVTFPILGQSGVRASWTNVANKNWSLHWAADSEI